VTALAARQHGIVSRAQLLQLDLSDDAIASRIGAGWLCRVHRGVFTVGRQPLTLHGRYLAAVWYLGGRAVLSHRSAAVLWGLLPESGPRVDVTVPSGARGRKAIVVHRSPLSAEESTMKDGIPVTTPARTVLDLAAVVSRRELERAMDEAAYLRLDLSEVQPRRGRRGSEAISRVLAEPGRDHAYALGDGGTHARALRLVELPRPLCNIEVEGYTVDFVWPQARLIVETDGWRAHGTRAAFERDRLRDAELAVADWRVVRMTWKRLTREPRAVAAQLSSLLAVR
jgi:very-short-patch-repair endonuclease